jgi:hypothetical protein
MRLPITALLLPAAWPLALALCLAACKTEPDLPADPHVPLINPFIGVWRANTDGQYWQFKTDGTGGRAAVEAGPFLNDFSFFVYAGQDVQTAPSQGSLLILEDSNDKVADGVAVTRYTFLSATEYWVTLTPAAGGGGGWSPMILERISGEPQPLSLKSSIIGEWSADWSLPEDEHGAYATWSIKYRDDGTVKTYHHEVAGGHQFENAYALRANTLVIYGFMRFSIAPVIGEITHGENGTWRLQETQTNPGAASWVYTKVDAAEWM